MAIRKEAKVSTFLKEVNLFEGLDRKVINEIYRIGMVQNFKKGDLIVREEQPSGCSQLIAVSPGYGGYSVGGFSRSTGRAPTR